MVDYGQPATAAFRLMQNPRVVAAIAKIKSEAELSDPSAW
jgi:hypothetical protein